MFTIGCHVSSSKGYAQMAKDSHSVGGNTFQFFTRNPRGGAAKKIEAADISEFNILCKEYNINKIVAHAPYTLNLCSADPKIREFALNTMQDDLLRMEYTPNNYYNFHPGSHVGQGEEVGIEFIATALNKVINQNQTTTILLETMAGKGSEIGYSFEQLKTIIDMVQLNSHLGVCLDTCHVYDAGYDIVNNLEATLEQFDKIIGIDRLKAIHLNDSKNPMTSHKDRHEKIGQGSLSMEGIKKIINCSQISQLPFILETPNELSGYAQEISLLKSLRTES